MCKCESCHLFSTKKRQPHAHTAKMLYGHFAQNTTSNLGRATKFLSAEFVWLTLLHALDNIYLSKGRKRFR